MTAVTNSSGVVQERYAYDAYGNVTMYDGPTSAGGDWSNPHTVSTQGNPILFGGMRQDPATGSDYDRDRWYDPSTGGFSSTDPAQSGANLYEYAGDDPTDFTDPSGLAYGGAAGSDQGGGIPTKQGTTCAQTPASAYPGYVPNGDAVSQSSFYPTQTFGGLTSNNFAYGRPPSTDGLYQTPTYPAGGPSPKQAELTHACRYGQLFWHKRQGFLEMVGQVG